MANPCRHPSFHFENGGLHLVCSNPECGYVYVAVGKCPGRIIQDIMARGMGFTENDVRADPFSLQAHFQSRMKAAPKVKEPVQKVEPRMPKSVNFEAENRRPDPDPNFGKPVKMISRRRKRELD